MNCLFFPNFPLHFSFKIIRDRRRLSASLLLIHVSPALFKQPTPFHHVPFLYCTFTVPFNNFPVNFRRKRSFSVESSYCRPNVTGSWIFAFSFNDYCEWGERYDNAISITHVFLDIQKTTDLHRKCALHLRGCYARSV